MRITNAMLTNQALSDLDGLRGRYAKAQSAVNGRVLDRPSEDPQRVVEAMDLSGVKLRLSRAMRSGDDAKEWLSVAENGMTAMIDQLQSARDVAVQAGSPTTQSADGRESLAVTIDSIKSALLAQVNTQHRDQYIYGGWKSNVQPFTTDAFGNVTYGGGVSQAIKRDVAPGLSVQVNVSGDQLFAGGDFMKTLTDMAADLRAGNTSNVTHARLQEISNALTSLGATRSDLGIRQAQVEKYQNLAQTNSLDIEQRLTDLTGGDLETSVLEMTQAQNAYQAALMSFSKALPVSLLDYMMR